MKNIEVGSDDPPAAGGRRCAGGEPGRNRPTGRYFFLPARDTGGDRETRPGDGEVTAAPGSGASREINQDLKGF